MKTLERQTVSQLLRLRGPKDAIFNKDGKLYFGNFYTKLEYYWSSSRFILLDSSIIYIFFYILISLSGYIYWELLYSLHLFDIVV